MEETTKQILASSHYLVITNKIKTKLHKDLVLVSKLKITPVEVSLEIVIRTNLKVPYSAKVQVVLVVLIIQIKCPHYLEVDSRIIIQTLAQINYHFLETTKIIKMPINNHKVYLGTTILNLLLDWAYLVTTKISSSNNNNKTLKLVNQAYLEEVSNSRNHYLVRLILLPLVPVCLDQIIKIILLQTQEQVCSEESNLQILPRVFLEINWDPLKILRVEDYLVIKIISKRQLVCLGKQIKLSPQVYLEDRPLVLLRFRRSQAYSAKLILKTRPKHPYLED